MCSLRGRFYMEFERKRSFYNSRYYHTSSFTVGTITLIDVEILEKETTS